ncbi:ankyrin repeat domain-containing protein [Pseudooceanicola sp. MF1-13]|uniref:ankyrin repeat domain-containing protein n=1 Tax=Pseudooceanicola sp. MF1-13 TaxID=3379095 RepID=UPI003891F999
MMKRLLDKFLRKQNDADTTRDSLHRAAFAGDVTRLRRLLEDDPSAVNAPHGSIISAAANVPPLHVAVAEGHADAARLLISYGAEIDRFSEPPGAVTPLLAAAAKGYPDEVALILELGADPNLFRSTDHASPLSFATHCQDDARATAVTARLLRAGANPDGSGDAHQTPLMLAARANLPGMVQALLDAGADPDRLCRLKWADGWTALDHAINESSARAEAILRPVTRTAPVATPGQVS